MATKQPNQKSQSQIPPQKEQNPPQQAPKDPKAAGNQQQAPPAAKDGKSSTQLPATQGKEHPDQAVNKNAPPTQASKTNLQAPGVDPNARKGSNASIPNNSALQAEHPQGSNRASVSKEPINNASQLSQPNSNPNQGAGQKNANSDLMGNFFDSLNPAQQQAQHGQQHHEETEDFDLKEEENENLKPIPTDDPKELERRKNQAEMFKKYLDNTGVSMAFQIIYAEILAKKINQENVFGYTAMRLRQIGNDLAAISHKVKK